MAHATPRLPAFVEKRPPLFGPFQAAFSAATWAVPARGLLATADAVQGTGAHVSPVTLGTRIAHAHAFTLRRTAPAVAGGGGLPDGATRGPSNDTTVRPNSRSRRPLDGLTRADRFILLLEPEFRVGSEPHQAQDTGTGLLVDQQQVRLQVAVPVVCPLAA